VDRTARSHHTTQPARVPLPVEARREVALIFLLFATARIMSVWWFYPLYSEAGSFFLPFAYLQDAGYYPFFDYWLEYPPILAYFVVGLRWVAKAICGAGSVGWERACLTHAVQLASIACELGTMGLLYALVRMLRGHKDAARACWIYAAVFATAFVALSYVDALPVFLMMVAVTFLVCCRPRWAAIAVAAGFMTKVLPIGLLPGVVKGEPRWRWRLAALGIFLVFVGYFAAPFLATGRQWLACCAEATMRRPPWQTVWALLEGRHEFGYVGPAREDQNDAFCARHGVRGGTLSVLRSLPAEVYGPPPVRQTVFYRVASRFARRLDFVGSGGASLPYVAALVVVGLFFLVTFARLPSALPPRRQAVFAAFCMVLVFVVSKGWSPQFVAYLVPLLLVAFPSLEGGLWAALLTVTAYLEMPIWAVHVHGREGLLWADLLLLHVATLARTAILLLVLIRLYPRLFRD